MAGMKVAVFYSKHKGMHCTGSCRDGLTIIDSAHMRLKHTGAVILVGWGGFCHVEVESISAPRPGIYSASMQKAEKAEA